MSRSSLSLPPHVPQTTPLPRCIGSQEVLSLHNLPKRGEHRPRRLGPCHAHAPALSGTRAPPGRDEPSSPAVSLSLHPIGGFCTISSTLPAKGVVAERTTSAINGNGLNPRFAQTFHCLAAEPHETFLKVSVVEEGGREVAYETCILGRLRPGYRNFRLRDRLGTRIELCHLFVRISFGREPNEWHSPTDLRSREWAQAREIMKLRRALDRLLGGQPAYSSNGRAGDRTGNRAGDRARNRAGVKRRATW